jgi:hypothetical protein
MPVPSEGPAVRWQVTALCNGGNTGEAHAFFTVTASDHPVPLRLFPARVPAVAGTPETIHASGCIIDGTPLQTAWFGLGSTDPHHPVGVTGTAAVGPAGGAEVTLDIPDNFPPGTAALTMSCGGAVSGINWNRDAGTGLAVVASAPSTTTTTAPAQPAAPATPAVPVAAQPTLTG